MALHAHMTRKQQGRLYTLSNLQIRDMQSYVSRLFLLVGGDSLKLVFIVDNGPWTTKEHRSRPAELWQLMVTQSRVSPFANRRRKSAGRHLREYDYCDAINADDAIREAGSKCEQQDSDKSGWSLLRESLQRRWKALARVKKPSHGLHGCVAFEVAWANVRGINYSNELQTDTCVALEVRTMTKREFDSLGDAQIFYASEWKEPILRDGVTSTSASEDDIHQRFPFESPASRCRCTSAMAAEMEDGSHNVWSSEVTGWSQLKRRCVQGASDSGPVRSTKTGILLDCEDEPRRTLEFLTPPSSPHDEAKTGALCHGRGSWECYAWCSGAGKDKTPGRQHIQEEVLDCTCSFCSQERHENAKELHANLANVQRNHCILSSLNTIENRGKSADAWGLCGALSYNNFDMGRPPGTHSRTDVLQVGACFLPETFQREEIRNHYLFETCHPFNEAETYRDTLVVFKFAEPMLPFELRRIITAEPRLLKMLESGLPPWVIFLQSYPIFSHLYWPWMRPLCGTIYYIVSVVTVLIGFYDLYKNVPVLKATAARICGPLFEWIEAWEMVSRLKYLGTMLVLQNCEKAFQWVLMTVRAVRHLSSLLMRPIVEPLAVLGDALLPLWTVVFEGVLAFGNLISTIISSTLISISSLLSYLIWPFCVLLSALWSLGVYPLLAAAWAVLRLPVQLVRMTVTLAAGLMKALSQTLQLCLASSLPPFPSIQDAQVPGPSIWRALWNDIFAKVFRAVRSIINGFVAFFAACNRHRLSIYNYVVACLIRLAYLLNSGRSAAAIACQQLFFVPGSRESISNELEAHEDDLRSSGGILRPRRGFSGESS